MGVAGPLSREAAALTGLREGIPIVMGANDTTSADYGAGAVNNGDILNISGSMVSEAYLQFKKKIFKGFDFNMKKECPTIGNAKVAVKLLG